MVDPSMIRILDFFLEHDDDDEEKVFIEPTKLSPQSNKTSNTDLLSDVIEELGEYNRISGYQGYEKPPASPPIDVKDLYLEDLIKIQQKLNDDSEQTLNDKLNKVDFEVTTTGLSNETSSYLDCMKQWPAAPVTTTGNSDVIPTTVATPATAAANVASDDSSNSNTFHQLQNVTTSNCPEGDFGWMKYLLDPNVVKDVATTTNSNAASSGFVVTGSKRSWSESSLPVITTEDTDEILPETCAMEPDSTTSESDVSEISSNVTTDKKKIRKIKNNEASRVHRAKKKRKYEDLFQKEKDLESKNAALKIQAESMQKEADFLRELLLVKVAASSNP